MRGLSEIRVRGWWLALLAGLSGAATVLIISGAGGRSAAQLAALAALRQRPAVTSPGHSSVAPTAAPGSPGPSAPAPSPSTTAPPVQAPTPTTQSQAATTPSPATTTQGSGSTGAPSSSAGTPASTLPKVGHVFEIALSTDSYRDAFGKQSAAPYLRSLESRGTLLSDFQSLGKSELADYLAMVSGQGPNADTSGGCATYAEFPQSTAARPDGLVRGNGCVYPETALTIGDQATASGHVWRAYVADMGAQTCAHPNSNAGGGALLPGTQPGYDTAHNPFIYFHSLLDLGDCAADDQDLSRLGPALSRRDRTAAFSFIAPGACDDAGTITPSTTTPSTTTPAATTSAACPAGQPVGIAAENAFLRRWVPRILASPAYRHNGVLIIAFAAAGQRSSAHAIRTGALVLSRYARRGKRIKRAFGPYSLLRSVEAMLGYKPLAHARSAPSFAAAVLPHN